MRLISPERLREVTAVAMSGMDQVFGMPTTWALGYAIGRPGALSAPQDFSCVFGIGGVGGSFAYGDAANGIAFALTKNRLTQDFSAVAQLSQMVTEALGER